MTDPKITDEMVRAGVLAARDHHLGWDLADLVREVYMAMELERREGAMNPDIVDGDDELPD